MFPLHFSARELAPFTDVAKAERMARHLESWRALLRQRTGRPVVGIVTSYIRQAAHNTAVGGAPDSGHLPEHASAVDVVWVGASDRDVMQVALENAAMIPDFGLAMIYDGDFHTHHALTRPGFTPRTTLRKLAIGDTIPVYDWRQVPILGAGGKAAIGASVLGLLAFFFGASHTLEMTV